MQQKIGRGQWSSQIGRSSMQQRIQRWARQFNLLSIASLLVWGASLSLAQTPTPTQPILYSVNKDDNILRAMSLSGSTTASYAVKYPITPFPVGTPTPFILTTALGWDSTAAKMYGVIDAYDGVQEQRHLVRFTLNGANADASDLGILNSGGDSNLFTGLSFDCSGNLYGVTDNPGLRGNPTPLTKSLYQVNPTNASLTHLCNLGGVSGPGESIAFYGNNLLYRFGGDSSFETLHEIDLSNVPASCSAGFVGNPAVGGANNIVYLYSQDKLLATGQSDLYSFDRLGQNVTFVGSLDHVSTGMALAYQPCGPAPPTATPTGPTPTPTITGTPTITPTPSLSPTSTPTTIFPGSMCITYLTPLPVPQPTYYLTPLTTPTVLPVTMVVSGRVQSTGLIQDLNFSLYLTHRQVGDLEVTLSHNVNPTGTPTIVSATIIQRPPGNGSCTGNDIENAFSDEAALPAQTSCDPLYGLTGVYPSPTPEVYDYQPASALSVFDGQDISGIWTLKITDYKVGDDGELQQWCLLPAYPPSPSPTEQPTPGGVPSRTPTPTATITQTSTKTPTKTATATGTRTPSPTQTRTPFPENCVEQLKDPSFEFGAIPVDLWHGTSTNFGSPWICSDTNCAGSTIGPRTGNYFYWFGGVSQNPFSLNQNQLRNLPARQLNYTLPERSMIQQVVRLSKNLAFLKFWYWYSSPSGNQQDYFRVLLDNVELFKISGNNSPSIGYQEKAFNLSSYADDRNHVIKFEGYFTGTPPGMDLSLDDISLCSESFVMGDNSAWQLILNSVIVLMAILALICFRKIDLRWEFMNQGRGGRVHRGDERW